MSSLLFLFELVGFAAIAYWAYLNDTLGGKSGSAGFLRMVDPQVQAPPAKKARGAGPGWRPSYRRADGVSRNDPRAKRTPVSAAAPKWKQPY